MGDVYSKHPAVQFTHQYSGFIYEHGFKLLARPSTLSFISLPMVVAMPHNAASFLHCLHSSLRGGKAQIPVGYRVPSKFSDS